MTSLQRRNRGCSRGFCVQMRINGQKFKIKGMQICKMCLKSPGTPLKASSAHICPRTFETHFTVAAPPMAGADLLGTTDLLVELYIRNNSRAIRRMCHCLLKLEVLTIPAWNRPQSMILTLFLEIFDSDSGSSSFQVDLLH